MYSPKSKFGKFLLGWIFGTLGMLFMPIGILLGYDYDIQIEKK